RIVCGVGLRRGTGKAHNNLPRLAQGRTPPAKTAPLIPAITILTRRAARPVRGLARLSRRFHPRAAHIAIGFESPSSRGAVCLLPRCSRLLPRSGRFARRLHASL